ncbi:unnamed protein product [Penicillium salamii]|nr:unnamed protein product [Penicillium salamii]CAG8121061.1 unnamed protein product [Penicillium salamii]
MPQNAGGAMIRMGLAILFLFIPWLVISGLSSATARFVIILRGRAQSNLATLSEAVLDIKFQSLLDDVLEGMVIVALISALFSFFGIVLVIHPTWLREDRKYRLYYGCTQLIVGLVALFLGDYVYSHVHAFQTSFELFDSEGYIPHPTSQPTVANIGAVCWVV